MVKNSAKNFGQCPKENTFFKRSSLTFIYSNSPCLYQIKWLIISCFGQLSLSHICYQSIIPPKSHRSQMEWEIKRQTSKKNCRILWDELWSGRFEVLTKFPFWYRNKNESKSLEGGWSGIGMATVGIHPTDLELDPTKIPPGGVVQNCRWRDQTERNIKINSTAI